MNDKTSSMRCLLIAPLTFYNFHHTLAEALERRGYTVDLLNEEFPANSLGKALGKIALPILRHTTLIGLKTRLQDRKPYDLIVIIKGRGLGPEALKYLKTRATRIVGYNFDSFEYNPSARDWYHLTDRYATFDILDAQSNEIPLVHLFSAARKSSASSEREYDLSIIQRVHSDRLLYAAKILTALPPGANPFVFLYHSSKFLFLLDVFRHPLLCYQLWPHISFTPLTYSEAMRVLGHSRITFDYAHPHQSGITVRCFEAQSVGTTILTNNRAAVESGIFEENSIFFLPNNAKSETIRKSIEELSAETPTPVVRTVDDLLNDLLAEDHQSLSELEHIKDM